ncbi:aldo/keto reductase [Atrimonas thermophila]|jgi:diketogulonate reductase-like aldo/keto reductase|uniref:aldo/keto reductase n=1 Tax=Atrimonas thermophila TaxID=3064161 RepID=UPI00399C5E91
MEYIQLPEGKMPVIGLGTWDLRGVQCEKAVLQALELGYRHIDTAEFYDNEEFIGKALRRSGIAREEIFLTSKVWYTHLRYAEVLKALDRSLEKLQTDYLDLYLIHWPNSEVPLEETLQAMAEAKEQGKIRHIGVSNFEIDLLEKAISISPYPVVNDQVEYHPLLSQKELLTYCQNHRIALTAYCPLARGRAVREPLIRDIAAKYGKTPAQVVLRWLIQQKMVVAIPKAASLEHQKENLEIFDFQLTEEDMQAISGLARGERVASRL